MSKKVYELASQLGIGAIDLVEKLNNLGLKVRNHMVSLTDEEVAKAMSALDETQKSQAAPKKTVVKKVVRKAPTAAAATVPVEEVAPPVVETASVEEETPEVVEPPKETKATKGVAVETTDESGNTKVVTIKRKTKLQKEEERREAEVQAQQAKDGEAGGKKEYLTEKMHTFTPIFVPEEKKKDENIARPAARRPVEGFAPASVDDEDSDAERSKKRMGDLASMVAKKTAVKSKEITQLRADEELKFAAALVGRAVYTPAKKKKVYLGPTQQTKITEVKESKRVLTMHGAITAEELAQKLSTKFESFANKMLQLNLLVKPDDYIGLQLANEMANLYNYRVDDIAFKEEQIISKSKEGQNDWPIRNPIITIMGHVDHGKTSLLDYIRKAKVAQGEAGGITQHIGAYSVQVKGSTLTFLDTPGHAAFGAMRQRGANVTDIVVLVVAADDGVMPQTVESIKYCQNANVPIMVAVNKMDKPGANPEKVKQGLMEYGLTPEEWGGETVFVPVSALKGEGIDSLLENIQLQAEVMELKANPKGAAEGVVIESKIELGRGPVATILIQTGTLSKGDYIVVGETMGRARSLMDFSGKMLNDAPPSTPVQVLGLENVPNPGDIMNVVKNEREATKIVENRVIERKGLANTEVKKVASLEDFFATSTTSTENKKVLKLIIRSDVQGSFEAIKSAVQTLGNDEVSVEVIGGGVGAISDNDVLLASSVKGYVIGFNMRPATSARRIAEEQGVEVKTYSIIYELINDITLALEGMLTPTRTEKYIGRAQVKDTFNIPKIGVIAGSSVIDGKIERGCNIRLLRDGKIVYDGKLSTLKRFKDDVKEVKNGYECGLSLENFNDVKVNALVEAYIMEEKKRTLDQASATL
jgi:translation initiation factor IF-2